MESDRKMLIVITDKKRIDISNNDYDSECVENKTKKGIAEKRETKTNKTKTQLNRSRRDGRRKEEKRKQCFIEQNK